MKKLIASIAAMTVITATLSASPRVTETDIASEPEKSAGVYYAYPAPTSRLTPAPKGYKPFYVSHYGRHGSRYLLSDNDYKSVVDLFHKAYIAGALTDKGKEVCHRLDSVWVEAEGRAGQLSPAGNRQHRAIGRRMGENMPDVFAPGADVTANSTTVMRCAHSMFSFIEGLKDKFPTLEIPRESAQRQMYYMSNSGDEAAEMRKSTAPAAVAYRAMKHDLTQPDRLVASLFSDPGYVSKYIDKSDLMWALYWIAIDMQNMETPVSFFDIFTPEELYALYRVFDFNFYSRAGDYPLALGAYTDDARNLLVNIIETADSYIGEGKHGATLRFGHDSNIVPLMGLMKVNGCHPSESDPYKLADIYSGTEICPMGANLQLVFYKNKQGDVLVKILLNEEETGVELNTPTFPYYKWDDLKNWLMPATGLATPM